MSSSCCGGSSKTETNKVATVAVTPVANAAAQQPATHADKDGCCGGKAEKAEKHSCGC
jgi:hypothetical protein